MNVQVLKLKVSASDGSNNMNLGGVHHFRTVSATPILKSINIPTPQISEGNTPRYSLSKGAITPIRNEEFGGAANLLAENDSLNLIESRITS